MALVLVLSVLVLLTALVIAFFSSVLSESKSAKNYGEGEIARQLADSAAQMVMAQVHDATKGFKDPSAPSATTVLAWASQPGMVRTFDQSGNPVKYYKLYSSDKMVETQPASFDPVADLPANWSAHPALFTDLNQPQLVPVATGAIIPDDGGSVAW